MEDSRPLHVVQYVWRWLPLTERWIYDQVRCLPTGISSHIVCEDTMNLEQFSLPEINRLSSEPVPYRVWDKAVRRVHLRQHLDYLVRVSKQRGACILHSHFGHIGWANIGAARGAHLVHVVTFYGMDLHRLPQIEPRWRRRYVELFMTANLVLCEGPHMAKRLVDLGCPTDKLVVHHLGVPVHQIEYIPRSWDGKGPMRILIAASFNEKKGIPDAIKAVGVLCERYSGVELTIIGDATKERRSQREKQKIISSLRDAGIADRTRLLGFLPYARLREEAYRHHVFLSPSRTASDGDAEGGAPVSLIEMSATGMPVVSTTHCDIPSVIKNGESGLLADEGDVDGLSKHLINLVEHPEHWPHMGAVGRAHVEQEYDACKQGAGLAEIYKSLIGVA